MKDETFSWMMNTVIVFLLVLAWATWYHRENAWTDKGIVEACLGAHCFEDTPVAPVKVDVPKIVKSELKPITAPQLFRTYRSSLKIMVTRKDFNCLARNVYYESRGESMAGKIAVAQVTWNRVKSKKWGDTFCDVVYAKKQFSWTIDAKHLTLPHGSDWIASKNATYAFLSGDRVSKLGKSDHYHAHYVDPRWNRHMQARGVVGNHIFYASNP